MLSQGSLDVLQKVRQSVADGHWMKSTFGFRDEHGEPHGCLYGLIEMHSSASTDLNEIVAAVTKTTGPSIPVWNDPSDRTADDVIELLDELLVPERELVLA